MVANKVTLAIPTMIISLLALIMFIDGICGVLGSFKNPQPSYDIFRGYSRLLLGITLIALYIYDVKEILL